MGVEVMNSGMMYRRTWTRIHGHLQWIACWGDVLKIYKHAPSSQADLARKFSAFCDVNYAFYEENALELRNMHNNAIKWFFEIGASSR